MKTWNEYDYSAETENAKSWHREFPMTAGEVGKHYAKTRTQLPIHRAIATVIEYAANCGYLGSLPTIEHGRSVGTIWIPGRTRMMAPSSRLDAHQQGRAVDLMVSRNPMSFMHLLARNLVQLSPIAGVSRVIFASHIWDSAGVRKYTGKSNHMDHIHCEVMMGACLLPYYDKAMGR